MICAERSVRKIAAASFVGARCGADPAFEVGGAVRKGGDLPKEVVGRAIGGLDGEVGGLGDLRDLAAYPFADRAFQGGAAGLAEPLRRLRDHAVYRELRLARSRFAAFAYLLQSGEHLWTRRLGQTRRNRAAFLEGDADGVHIRTLSCEIRVARSDGRLDHRGLRGHGAARLLKACRDTAGGIGHALDLRRGAAEPVLRGIERLLEPAQCGGQALVNLANVGIERDEQRLRPARSARRRHHYRGRAPRRPAPPRR